jgi:signal transduction histidine kinase
MPVPDQSEEQITAAAQAEQRLRRRIRIFSLQWMIFILIAQGFAVYNALSTAPAYWHDWRAPAIILLSLALIALFFLHFFHFRPTWERLHHHWPPSLRYSFSFWVIGYLICLFLTLISRELVWSFFVLMGLCFAMFGFPTMLYPLILSFATFLTLIGVLRWPPAVDLGALISFSLIFFSSLLSAITVSLLFNEQGRNARLLGELTQTHAELEEAHQRLAAAALQAQELAVLRERARLAREMHDTVGHALSLIAVKLEAIRRLQMRDPARCEREIAETLQIARETMNELRASIANLRSPALERQSFGEAISDFARALAERSGLQLELEIAPDLEPLPEDLQEALWKIVQEALTNVEKHAGARHLSLQLRRQSGRVYLRIVDDGRGLPPALMQDLATDGKGERPPLAVRQGHYGLIGMQERARQLNGELRLLAGPNGGLLIEGSFPLVELPREAAS